MIQQLFSFMFTLRVENYVHTKTCPQKSTAALFIIAKTGRQPRYLSLGEWTNKLWYNQATEY